MLRICAQSRVEGSFARQFILFAGVGMIGTAAHYLVLIVLVGLLKVDPVRSSIMGSLVGAIINYSLNYRYTFRSHKGHVQTGMRFAAASVLGLSTNAGMMEALVRYTGIHYLPAQVLATGAALIANFLGNRFWVFKTEKYELLRR